MKDFRARRWQQEDRNPMMTVFEKAGRYPDIIDLSIGDPDLKTPQKIIDLAFADAGAGHTKYTCLLYTSPSPRDRQKSRMPSSA